MERSDTPKGFGWTDRLRNLIHPHSHSESPIELPSAAQDRMIKEIELYLDGDYADWLSDQARHVPAWAWINRLAHGSQDEIIRLAGCTEPDDLRWELIADLARQLVSASERIGIPVRALQISTMIPLESRLRELFDSASPTDRAELGSWILAALANRETRHQS